MKTMQTLIHRKSQQTLRMQIIQRQTQIHKNSMKCSHPIFVQQEEMRDTNESTNSRVLYFSLFSMCCLLGLATWQVGRNNSYTECFIFPILGALPEKVLQVQEADRIKMKVITVRTEES